MTWRETRTSRALPELLRCGSVSSYSLHASEPAGFFFKKLCFLLAAKSSGKKKKKKKLEEKSLIKLYRELLNGEQRKIRNTVERQSNLIHPWFSPSFSPSTSHTQPSARIYHCPASWVYPSSPLLLHCSRVDMLLICISTLAFSLDLLTSLSLL